VFSGFDAGGCRVAEQMAGELFTLLVHPTVMEADLDGVVEAVGKVAVARN
jgi:dTDP-4-amino-4,6-dideoxygalactose transaminase